MIADQYPNYKKLRKFLDHWYWKHHQVLIFDTFEIRTTESSGYDVCLWDPDDTTWNRDSKTTVKGAPHKFLFTMSNYHTFMEARWAPDMECNRDRKKIIYNFDACRASCTPYYFDGNFFLPTWKPLKTKDIEQCAEYFVHQVLGMKFRIWNIRVNDYPEQDLNKLMEKEHSND